MAKVQLGYWKIRGLAQPISMNKEMVLNSALPYLIDGDIKITQSNAILRHIARKHNLDGKDEKSKVLVDVMENQAMDFRNGFVRLCYGPDFEKNKEAYLKNVVSMLELFEKYLADKTWFAGNEITFVDFVMYELLDQHKLFDAKLLSSKPKLTAFLDRFEALPQIKAYMATPCFMARPVNNKSANWK
ncbi:GST [Acanthosepion pharaonis]|uniref:glutathione transferase n=1 Tax=Acanthosepion pharaonis TaxID=158019 RepID=A0A812D8R0_ACAPH|nr:GST [Sepia pharaonis]